MKKYGYIPLRRHKFIAVEKATGRKALAGGICTATKHKVAKSGRCEFVEALDWNNQERFFAGNRWRFVRRE